MNIENIPSQPGPTWWTWVVRISELIVWTNQIIYNQLPEHSIRSNSSMDVVGEVGVVGPVGVVGEVGVVGNLGVIGNLGPMGYDSNAIHRPLIDDLDEVAPEDTSDFLLCCVCQSNYRRIVVLPCSHNAMCGTCTHKILADNKLCPICRCVIDRTISYHRA